MRSDPHDTAAVLDRARAARAAHGLRLARRAVRWLRRGATSA